MGFFVGFGLDFRFGFKGELLPFPGKLHEGGAFVGLGVRGMDTRFPRQLPVALGALPGRKPRQFRQG